jgi:hypothetical protein
MDPNGPPPRTPAWLIVLTVLAGLWISGLAVLPPLFAYGLDFYVAATDGTAAPGGWSLLATAVVAVLALVPAALLGWLPRLPAVRHIGQAWTWASVASVVLAAARLVPPAYAELYLGLLATAAAGLAFIRRRGGGWSWAELAPGLVLLLPWASFGALGGLAETLAGAGAAAAIGWLAARITAPLHAEGTWVSRILIPGLAAGVALAPVAAATGGSGVALAELFVLPPLGFALAALGRRSGGLLVALAAAGPLLFVDSEETSLLLGTHDMDRWTLLAGLAAFPLALLVGLGLAASYGRVGVVVRRPVAAALAVLAAVALGTVYLGFGRPGLYGEHVLVVMRAQTDLTGLAAIPDRAERLRQTYRRLVDTAEASQHPLRAELRRLHLGFRPYYLVNAIEVNAGPAARVWLARRSDVDRVLLNPTLRPLPAEPGSDLHPAGPPPTGPQWNIKQLKADQVWDTGDRGAGIVIGSSDSGVDGTHPALSAGFRGGDDSWYDPWNNTRSPTDHFGHGTHTVGTAVGRFGIGVAPDAQWIGCVNLDRNLGSPGRYLDCLQFMLAPFKRGGDPWRDGRPERAPDILTNSWGCPPLEGCDRQVLRPAVAALTAAGIFFVAAAGNSGPGCRTLVDLPAPVPEAFTVGAVDEQGRLASFSSRGPAAGPSPKPDVVAPGVAVRSALPGGGYGELDGTSMATPHVAGVVALMWAANPKLIGDIPKTANLLRATAEPPEGTARSRGTQDDCGGPANTIGAGLVDAYAAVAAARAA